MNVTLLDYSLNVNDKLTVNDNSVKKLDEIPNPKTSKTSR